MMQQRNRKICLLAIVGSVLLLASHCKSHQMSISNTWTLPQDGFTVMYRFFRDKISWYEADAVCQFHHANLVTVDNGVKYDASRAYLSDLNVTENVWIGLMRSQNSDRFMWSNSKILDREFGYWAEQIPSIDSPLCAVVDPTRDYRWHSLRCGGPDVASFLCEMEPPEWASECLIRALPSLTIQYIADSATIELSRDCGGSEGIRRLTCTGKQDQDLIQRELMCQSERESITSDNEMKVAIAVAAEQLPEDVVDTKFDNMEYNNIDKIPNQIEASIDKLGEKINLDEMMMGDAPIAMAAPDDDVKPMKNAKKFASEKLMKNQTKQMRKVKNDEDEKTDFIMMGDQPAAVASLAEEILPHVKKMRNDDYKNSEEIATTSKSVAEIQKTTIEVRSRRETENPVKVNISGTTTEMNIKTESNGMHLPHKEITNDHFIPPMLLVQHKNLTEMPSVSTTTIGLEATVAILNTTSESSVQENQIISTQQAPKVPATPTNANDLGTINSNTETSSILTSHTSYTVTTQEPTTASNPSHIHHDYPKIMMRPHAPKFGGEISYHAQPTTTKAPANKTYTVMEIVNATETAITSENITSSIDIGSTITPSISVNSSEVDAIEPMQSINETVTEARHLEVAKRSKSAVTIAKHQKHNQEQQHKLSSHKHLDDPNTKHADFTNSNLDYESYKPNRKRILTKPETHTFIQKVFG